MTVMHPHLLHALAASWSLDAAFDRLRPRIEEEDVQIAAEEANRARDGVRSQQWGNRGGGGHGDPTAASALLEADSHEPRPNLWRQLAESINDSLRWLTVKLDCAYQDRWPLYCLRDAIPTLRPGQAQNLTLWLRDYDERIRKPLQMPPDLTVVDGQCPACRQRLLYATPQRLVVCRATGCLCTGESCACGMPVRVEGVAHIWTAPPVAQALVRDH